MQHKSPIPANVHPSPISGGRAVFAYLLITLCLVGFHLRVHIYSGNGSVLVPNYLILVPGAILAIAQANSLLRRVGNPLVGLAIFMAFHPLLTFAPTPDAFGNFLSSAQLFAAVVACMALVLTASRLPARGLRRLFLGCWATLMALAALETVGLRSQMQSITLAIYAGTDRGIYGSDARDIVIYGRPRPTALASEPSFLADSWIFMTVLVFLLSSDRGSVRSWIRLLAMVVVGAALAPSASVFFVLLATALWHFWPQAGRANLRLMAAFAVGAVLFTPSLGSLLNRFETVQTGSFFARVTSGPLVGAEALTSFPILGYGIGNTDGVAPIILRVWESSGSFARWPWFLGTDSENMMANAFWWQWIGLGLLGGAIFVYVILRLLASIGVKYPLRTLVCAWIVWYSGGSFVSPESWLIFAFFAIPDVARLPVSDPASDPPARSDVIVRGPGGDWTKPGASPRSRRTRRET